MGDRGLAGLTPNGTEGNPEERRHIQSNDTEEGINSNQQGVPKSGTEAILDLWMAKEEEADETDTFVPLEKTLIVQQQQHT